MSVRWGAAIQKPSSNTSNSSNANEAAANSPALPVPLLSPLSFTPSPAFAPKEQSDALNSAESKNESQNVTVESHVIPVKPSEPKPARLNAVETAQRERLRREYERLNAAESKIRNENATKVQNWCLGHLQRKRALAMLRTEWDAEWSPASWNSKDAVKSAQNVMSGIIQTLKASSMLLVFYTPAKDGERLEGLVKALSDRLGSVQTSITTLFLNSSYRESVIRVLQRLCMACLERVLGKHLAGTRNSMPRKGSTTFELRFLLLFYNLDSYKLPNVARTGPSSVEISREAHERVVSFVFAGPDTGLKLSGIYEGIRDLLREQVVAAFGGSAGAKKSTANQPDVKVVALLRLVALISARSSTTNLCFGYIADSEHLNELVVCVLGGVPLVFSLVDGSTLAHFSRERVLQRSLALFASKEFEKHRDSIIARLGADGLLVLAANLVTLFRAQPTDGSGVQFGELLRTLNVLVKASHSLLDSNSDDSKTSSPTVRKKGQASTYHPLLGFVAASLSIPSNSGSVAVYQRLVSKLAWIWSSEAIGMGFARILAVFGGQGVVDAANVALLAIEAKEACEFNIRLADLLKPHRSDIYQSIAFAVPNLLVCLWRMMCAIGGGTGDRTAAKAGAAVKLGAAVKNLKIGKSKPDTPDSSQPLTDEATVALVSSRMNVFVSAARSGDPKREPLMWILELFCEGMVLLFLTLDDEEVYIKQAPFKLQDVAEISIFLNLFLFQLYFYNTGAVAAHQRLIDGAKRLLGLLHDRNDRRAFVRDEDWIIKDTAMIAAFDPKKLEGGIGAEVGRLFASAAQLFRSGSSSASTQSGKDPASPATPLPSPTIILDNLPQTVPFKVRVALLRDTIRAERNTLSTASFAPVKIRRKSILEDGYQHLGRLSPFQLKQRVTVKFVNELGMEESGIDQFGVFKEFLEQLCKQAFAPATGLFRAIGSTEMIFPNPLSHMVHDNDLKLFEFLGRMLGKAVYEGIVIDIPFGLFFYAKILNRYNTFDDLPSLDPELYKQLTFIKHYPGDITDLGLTFSFDENVFGKIETREIKPGGSAIDVTNENRFAYIYLLSDYHLNQQARRQTQAFMSGFKSLIPDSWLRFFSPLELQRLLSGEGTDYDVAELRANAAYEGGYSDAHPTIRALWETVESFDAEDRKRFLRFVTSCSRAPVGGFSYLEPKFTIRYVADDTKSDSLGPNPFAVMGSYLGLGGKDPGRLPTSATCFNRLMLPAFKSKAVLKDKLRTAIRSGAGFELA